MGIEHINCDAYDFAQEHQQEIKEILGGNTYILNKWRRSSDETENFVAETILKYMRGECELNFIN